MLMLVPVTSDGTKSQSETVTVDAAAIRSPNGFQMVSIGDRRCVRERRPSYRYTEELRVGTVLPESGVTYYDVPAEYRAKPGYRYTYVNDRPVLVEPRTRRIVEIID